ncbi:class I histocompatibility antigen, F10 alpha chain-like, partial [Arapaima gigas]
MDTPAFRRVRVTQRTEAHSGRTQVSCLATGFYPRRINVTLLRDGRPVPDQELTGGQALPNGDGTYQRRRSLSVKAEDPPHTVILCAVLGSVLVVLVVVTVTVFRCRTKTGSQNSCETSAGVKCTAAHSECLSITAQHLLLHV